MEYEKPQESNIYMEETKQGTLFVVKPEKKWSILLFLSFWLIGWAVGEVFAIATVLSDLFGNTDENSVVEFNKIFMFVWLGGWTVGGFLAIKTLLWQIAGKEIIIVNHDSISILTDSVIYKKRKSYAKNYIKDIRVIPGDSNPFNQVNFGNINIGKIAFDYGAKTIKFGIMEEESEAKNVVNSILNKYPKYGA